MNQRTVLFLLMLLISTPATAVDISDFDLGTYVVLGKDRAPVDMFYRLSRSGGQWIMEGKQPGGSWQNISCDRGCDYRKSTEVEIASFFPREVTSTADIACIQNIAQAFCRYTPKGDETKVANVVFALVTGKPIPLFIRRVNVQ